jgi:DNA polymerase/3'-5' exonuclease PolX
MNLAAAQKLAIRIRDELAPFCEQIEVAGSIRRQRLEPHDVDMVCLPKGAAGKHDVIERCLRSARCTKTGEQYRVFELQGGFQLDLWLAHPAERDVFDHDTPDNFATLLVCRTGSAEFNMMLARRAREVGLHWNPHGGLMKVNGQAFVDYRGADGRREGKCIPIGSYLPTPTEEDFFKALSVEFIKPEDREA